VIRQHERPTIGVDAADASDASQLTSLNLVQAHEPVQYVLSSGRQHGLNCTLQLY
jgi:hypothetical protein